MLVEVLAVGLFIYLQFTDKYLSLWAMAAALLSLVGKGGSILIFTCRSTYESSFIETECLTVTLPIIRGVDSIILFLKCDGMEDKLCRADLSVHYTSSYSGIFDIRPSHTVFRCRVIGNPYLFIGSRGAEFLLVDALILHLL
jgi:hypothetical protein